jgi:hypothetical protein
MMFFEPKITGTRGVPYTCSRGLLFSLQGKNFMGPRFAHVWRQGAPPALHGTYIFNEFSNFIK